MTEEILQQYVDSMGPDLGPTHYALYNDLTWLHVKWAFYRQLFAASRIRLLNDTAATFFGVLQRALLEDIALHLARLTDSVKSCGKSNLVLARLPSLIEEESLRAQVNELVRTAEAACGVFRVWRNRRLAHRDLQLVLVAEINPLPGISWDDVEGALRACRQTLNCVELHYRDSEVSYDHVVTGPGDVSSLLLYLESGLRFERAQEERSRFGHLTQEVAAAADNEATPDIQGRTHVNIDLTRMLRGLPAERFRQTLAYLEETNPLAVRRWRRSLSAEGRALLEAVDERDGER